ncbi:MAG TPA: S46 family peptidase [Pseudomonadota bacterium]|nr:S46 family peptidase [Pseudomonadota bacterium]
MGNIWGRSVLLGGFLFCGLASADEGMWPIHQLPKAAWQKRHNFAPSDEWLLHNQRAAVRLSDGGSGSLVSDDGLLLTNHHVARGQLHKLSTPERDLLRDGFYARTLADELRCPDLEIRILWSHEDVTERVRNAIDGKAPPEKQNGQRKKIIAELEKESSDKTGLRSDVVALHSGGQYVLYRYKTYQDIRMVFAPEEQAAIFGGDFDNFTYPRYALDFAILRVYEDGQPLRPEHFLRLSDKPPESGDLVVTVGHPASTQRGLTVAQRQYHRDTQNPLQLDVLKKQIAAVTTYMAQGSEQTRRGGTLLRHLENRYKRLVGQQAGLLDLAQMQKLKTEEDALRAEVRKRPELLAKFGDAWFKLQTLYAKLAPLGKRHAYVSISPSKLLTMAVHLVRLPEEMKKPNGERLEEYRESRIPALHRELLSTAPIYADLEEAVLADWFAQVQTALGNADPFVQALLNGQTPANAARKWIGDSKLSLSPERTALFQGGAVAVQASTDPLMVLAKKIEPLLRKARLEHEQQVQAVENIANAQIAQARFSVFGTDIYPDATYTLRFSLGEVKGYMKDTRPVPHQTLFYGLLERSLSQAEKSPFDLPTQLRRGLYRLPLWTPMNFVFTSDTIGGNSGSPVVDRDGKVVGLNFDSNLEKLANRYYYVPDEQGARAVAVHSVAILAALRTLYDAGPLADKLVVSPTLP